MKEKLHTHTQIMQILATGRSLNEQEYADALQHFTAEEINNIRYGAIDHSSCYRGCKHAPAELIVAPNTPLITQEE